MNALLEDFLTIGRLNEGKTVVCLAIINLKELITETIAELDPLRKEGQQVAVQYSGKEKIETDGKLLKTILLNLIGNALKFSGAHKKVDVIVSPSAKGLVISIKDRGIGINSMDKQYLFESFHRGKNAQNIQGTGLGLHIVKRYVLLLHGEVSLESELNKGTTVRVFLPNE
jgi:signal transduction histidine kinase